MTFRNWVLFFWILAGTQGNMHSQMQHSRGYEIVNLHGIVANIVCPKLNKVESDDIVFSQPDLMLYWSDTSKLPLNLRLVDCDQISRNYILASEGQITTFFKNSSLTILPRIDTLTQEKQFILSDARNELGKFPSDLFDLQFHNNFDNSYNSYYKSIPAWVQDKNEAHVEFFEINAKVLRVEPSPRLIGDKVVVLPEYILLFYPDDNWIYLGCFFFAEQY